MDSEKTIGCDYDDETATLAAIHEEIRRETIARLKAAIADQEAAGATATRAKRQ